MIMETKAYIENKFQGAEVIYGDTDSVFVRFPKMYDTMDKIFAVMNEAATGATTLFPEVVVLEPEKVFCPFLLVKDRQV